MPVIINGTTGISGTDGSASIPAVQGTDTNTGRFFPAADTIAFGTNGTEDFRIGPAGQFGIQGANYGTSGQVLTSAGAAAPPAWQTVSTNGLLLNVQVFTSSGTYTRTAGATRAVVIAVGGGGGGGGGSIGAAGGTGGNGGTTSFGSHVTAVGGTGAVPTTNASGAGGTGGTGATIAIRGQPGGRGVPGTAGTAGFGGGLGGGTAGAYLFAGGAGVRGGGGGGAGGYTGGGCCLVYYQSGGGGQGENAIDYIATGLNATETVTIGAGGAGGTSNTGTTGGAGGAGYVIVYEYS